MRKQAAQGRDNDERAVPLLSEQLCFAVYSASHALSRRYKPLLAKLDLTYPQYLCMMVLWEADGQTVGAIGARLHLDSGTLTPLLKRLEAGGLVSRERDRQDERQVRVMLTAKGRSLADAARDFPNEIACATRRSAADLSDLRKTLVALRDQLNIIEADAIAEEDARMGSGR